MVIIPKSLGLQVLANFLEQPLSETYINRHMHR